jgi:anion-transporting  ArsA/GET3 family ATPase
MTAEELPVLPGMDVFTALGALRKFTLQYDTVIYDGPSASEVWMTNRMLEQENILYEGPIGCQSSRIFSI